MKKSSKDNLKKNRTSLNPHHVSQDNQLLTSTQSLIRVDDETIQVNNNITITFFHKLWRGGISSSIYNKMK